MRYPIIISLYSTIDKTCLTEMRSIKEDFPLSVIDAEFNELNKNLDSIKHYADIIENEFIHGYNDVDIALVSSNERVRQELVNRKIKFIMVYPDSDNITKQNISDNCNNEEKYYIYDSFENSYIKMIEDSVNFSKENNIPIFFLRGNYTLYDSIESIISMWISFYKK